MQPCCKGPNHGSIVEYYHSRHSCTSCNAAHTDTHAEGEGKTETEIERRGERDGDTEIG